jgi:hypothetical protein
MAGVGRFGRSCVGPISFCLFIFVDLARDTHWRGSRTIRLLHDVRQLMGKKQSPLACRWDWPARANHEVSANRVGFRVQLQRGSLGVGAHMEAHVAKIPAKPGFKERPSFSV